MMYKIQFNFVLKKKKEKERKKRNFKELFFHRVE